VPASAPPASGAYAPPVPQGYAPAVSAGYAPAVSAGSTNSSYDVIDPALAAADPNMHGQHQPNGVPAANVALRGVAYQSPVSDAPPIRGMWPRDLSSLIALHKCDLD
jgi:hypothetical protein